MQTKKDEVKTSLLLAAQQEIMEKGFKKASIRNIVKKANTTIGNFYNYFESKEEIFSNLVDKAYGDLVFFIKNHQETELASTPIEKMDINFLREYLGDIMLKLVPRFDDDFYLLVECAQDTKYAHVKEELIDFIGLHFLEHIEEYSPNYIYPQMGRIISGQIVHAIIEIIKTNKDIKIRHALITEQILFTSLGVMGILQGYMGNKND